jgi:GDPmannose 4,6-dehydratase
VQRAPRGAAASVARARSRAELRGPAGPPFSCRRNRHFRGHAHRGCITGITGPGRLVPRRTPPREGLSVVGVVRRSSTTPYERIGHLVDRIELVSADLLDQTSLTDAVAEAAPDEIYNLAAQSFVQTVVVAAGAHRRVHRAGRHAHARGDEEGGARARFYQASSSEQFGKVVESPQRESTPFYPRSPYGVAKVYGHWITVNYRESFGLYAVSGILFNHESPGAASSSSRARSATACAASPAGLSTSSASATSTRAATGASPATTSTPCGACCSRTTPDDYVIGTGETWSVRQFCERFRAAGLDSASSSAGRALLPAAEVTCSSATRAKARRSRWDAAR